MQILLMNRRLSFWIGVLLSFPAAYFIGISVLKYGLGFRALFDAATPVLEIMGIKESLGWNINLLILLGPLVALTWNFFSFVKIKWHNEKEQWQLNCSIHKHWLNIVVAGMSFMVLLVLFTYLIGENCRC